MLTRNCPIKNGKTCAECDKKGKLTDRKGIEFPVMCRAGYSEILNSRFFLKKLMVCPRD